MTNTELILNMLAEASTKDISVATNPKDDVKTIARFKAILPSTKEILQRSGIALLLGVLLLVILVISIKTILIWF